MKSMQLNKASNEHTITVCEGDQEVLLIHKSPRYIYSEFLSTPPSFVSKGLTRMLAPDRITLETYYTFLEGRVISKEREDLDIWLERWGLIEWDPEMICTVTHGTKITDRTWLKFDDEDVKYDDVRII